MRSAAIRVVRDKHVARLDPRIVGQDAADRFAHRAQVDWDMRSIDHQFARRR